MDNGFVKIYGSRLISSSLWDEAPEARLVFLCMLALADAKGYVDVPNETTLARVLNLAPDYLARGLAVLMAPDTRGSRTPDHQGRRVLRHGSGWMCVNYEKYREIRTNRQVAAAERVARWREKQAKPLTDSEERDVKRLTRGAVREQPGEEDFERPGRT